MALAGYRGIDQQPADMKMAEVEIDVREERAVGIGARPEGGKAHQMRGGAVERAYVDMAAQVSEGTVIHVGPVGVKEDALRIGERDVDQPHLAEDRALDPADMDLERSEERRVGQECRSRRSPYH